jgi:hypothetical protein
MTGRDAKRQEAVHDGIYSNLAFVLVATSSDTRRHLATVRDGLLQSTLQSRCGGGTRQPLPGGTLAARRPHRADCRLFANAACPGVQVPTHLF